MDKQETKEDIKDNGTLAEELEERLKEEFEKVIDNPTDKQIKEYREVEEALLAAWLVDTMSNITAGINENIKNGKSTAVEQLRKKGFKKVEDNEKIYSELANAKKQQVRADLEKIVASIKQNSRKNIAEMREAFILQKKKLTAGFMKTFKKYGVTYFTDRAGRKWDLKRYIDMATTTVLASTNRQAFFAKSLEWGNDLVKVIHLNLHPECPLCAPFNGKVLSISGKTKGFMTWEQAQACGLGHPNCDHIAEAFELAPEREPDDHLITLSEQNKKSLERNNVKISTLEKVTR